MGPAPRRWKGTPSYCLDWFRYLTRRKSEANVEPHENGRRVIDNRVASRPATTADHTRTSEFAMIKPISAKFLQQKIGAPSNLPPCRSVSFYYLDVLRKRDARPLIYEHIELIELESSLIDFSLLPC